MPLVLHTAKTCILFRAPSFSSSSMEASLVFVRSLTFDYKCCKCIFAPGLYDLTASTRQPMLPTLVVFIPNLLLSCSCFVMRQPFLAAVILAPNEREYI